MNLNSEHPFSYIGPTTILCTICLIFIYLIERFCLFHIKYIDKQLRFQVRGCRPRAIAESASIKDPSGLQAERYLQFHKDGQPQLVRCHAYACMQRTTNRIFGTNSGKPERIQVKFYRYIVCRTQISHVRIWAPGPTGRKTAGKSDCFCKGYNEVAFLCINGTERMKLGKNVN